MINSLLVFSAVLFVVCFMVRSFPGLLVMFAVIVLLIGLGGCVQFDRQWTTENRRLETAYQLMHAVDGIQTLQAHNLGYREKNPSLGDYPSSGKIGAWYLMTAYGHAYTTDSFDQYAPRWACRTWQVLTMIETAEAIRGNFAIGLRLGF